MEPAYRAGDRVLVNRLAYLRRGPAVGDVVVLRDPERPGHHLLKRIAQAPDGAPGPVPGATVAGGAAVDRRPAADGDPFNFA